MVFDVILDFLGMQNKVLSYNSDWLLITYGGSFRILMMIKNSIMVPDNFVSDWFYFFIFYFSCRRQHLAGKEASATSLRKEESFKVKVCFGSLNLHINMKSIWCKHVEGCTHIDANMLKVASGIFALFRKFFSEWAAQFDYNTKYWVHILWFSRFGQRAETCQ